MKGRYCASTFDVIASNSSLSGIITLNLASLYLTITHISGHYYDFVLARITLHSTYDSIDITRKMVLPMMKTVEVSTSIWFK